MRILLLIKTLSVAAVASLLMSCASTQIVAEWKKPDFSGPAYTNILVAGIFKQETTRRVVEDDFVRQMIPMGATGYRSYTFITQDNNMSKADLQNAVQTSSADALLVLRLIKVDKETVTTPGYNLPESGIYDYWSWAWDDGYFMPPETFQFDVVTVEASLVDIKKKELIWSCTSQITDPHDTNRDLAGFTAKILGALRKDKCL